MVQKLNCHIFNEPPHVETISAALQHASKMQHIYLDNT